MHDKTMTERAKECINIIKKITESLGIPADSYEVTELRNKMNEYIRSGETWIGTVDFSHYGRIAECSFPKKAGRLVEVTLKKIN
jgi:hypothetical protein